MDALRYHANDTASVDQTRSLATSANVLPGLKLHRLLGILSRQYKVILAAVLLVLALVTLILSQLDYRYTASAMLVIDESESQLVGLDAAQSLDASLNNRVDTEVETLKSSSVALGAIDRLQLWNDHEFGIFPTVWQRLLSIVNLTRSPPRQKIEATSVSELSDDRRAKLVDNLSEATKVSRRGLTSVISISTTSLSPQKAAKISNAIAESYFNLQIEARAKIAQRAADFLQARVNELAQAIRDDDSRIDGFIGDQSDKLGTPESREELSRVRDQASELLSKQSLSSTQLQKLQELQINPTFSRSMNLGFAPQIHQLVDEHNRLFDLVAENSESIDLKRKLDDAELRLRSETENHIADLQKRVKDYDNELSGIRNKLRGLISEQSVPQSMAVDLYRLQRDAETNRKLYDSYLTRLAEVQQKISLALPNSRIMASAIVPHEPSFPPTKLILALSLFVALGLGGSAAVVREHIVGGFASPEQLESVTQLPVLGVIPHYDDKNPHDAILMAPFSALAESIRRIRISVENLIDPGKPNVILLSSTEPNEGKTTVAVCLARAFATSGRRTLLIDCDLRRAAVHRMTDLKSPGKLIDLILTPPTREQLSEAFVKEPDSGLCTIDAESTERFASDILMASTQFEKLIETAKSLFDIVVLDSPPIGYVVDARVISRLADLTLYVVRYGFTSQRDVLAGIREMLNARNAPPMGVALNNAQELLGGYYYRKNKYSNYYRST